jgi:agmatine/peptidylarginine deiminase
VLRVRTGKETHPATRVSGYGTGRPSPKGVWSRVGGVALALWTAAGCASWSGPLAVHSPEPLPPAPIAAGFERIERIERIGAGNAELRVDPWMVAVSKPVSRTLRGDWDATSAVVVAYEQSWRRPLRSLIRAASRDLPVLLLASPEQQRKSAFRRWARTLPRTAVLDMTLDSPWVRDYGPVEIVDHSSVRWLDFVYSPDSRPLDDAVPQALGAILGGSTEGTPVYLEGGGAISNGSGLCALTEATLEAAIPLNDAAQALDFLEALGCQVIARLPDLPEEPTGHADMIAQFLTPDTVALSAPTGSSSQEVAAALQGAREALVRAAVFTGIDLRIVELPLHNEGERYYSYVNGLRTPRHFLVPSYRHVPKVEQRRAHRRLRRALPGVRVVPIASDAMIERGGAVHCVSLGLKRPLPAGARALAAL